MQTEATKHTHRTPRAAMALRAADVRAVRRAGAAAHRLRPSRATSAGRSTTDTKVRARSTIRRGRVTSRTSTDSAATRHGALRR